MDAAKGMVEVTEVDRPEGPDLEESCIEVPDSLLQFHVFVEENALKSYSAQSCCT